MSWFARLSGCLLVLFWVLPEIQAEHGGPRIHLFPAFGTVLPSNAMITIHSTNGEDSRLPKRGARGLFLVGEGDRVPLRVIERHRDYDGYGEAASVLRPTRRLKQGLRYHLEVSGLGFDKARVWTVSGLDLSAPRWMARPKIPSLVDQKDEGDTIEVRIKDESAVQMRLLVEGADGERRSALMDLGDPEDCAFTGYLTGGLKAPMRLRMIAVDSAGNEAPAPGRAHRVRGDLYLCSKAP